MAKQILLNTVIIGARGTWEAGSVLDDVAMDVSLITNAGGKLVPQGQSAIVDAASAKCVALRKAGQSGEILEGIMSAAMDATEVGAANPSATSTLSASSGIAGIGAASDSPTAGGLWCGIAGFLSTDATVVGLPTLGAFIQNPLLVELDVTAVAMLKAKSIDGSNASLELLPVTSGKTKKFSIFGVTPVARAAAYTQTYSTASRTVAAATATAVATTVSTQTTPFGFSSGAQADALVAAVNALIADNLVLRQLVNSLIDDQQAYGYAQ